MRSTVMKSFKVAVLGGAGGIGQPMSLLLKNSPMITELRLYDLVNAPGVACDLSHISTPAVCTGYGKDDLEKAVKYADVVLIPAGVPRKPGMTRDDLFNMNATTVKTLVGGIAKWAPKAIIGIIANPVNSTVPIASEVLKKAGVYDPRKLFGVTTLDILRTKTFLGQVAKRDPASLNVTVVGGHSGPTIVPLLSQIGIPLTQEEIAALTNRIQYGGDEVVKAKDGTGSATLSMAVAGADWTFSILKALRGERGVVECTFVESPIEPKCAFFSSRVELGTLGVEKILPLGPMSKYEQELMGKCVPELAGNIKKGIEFGRK